MSTSQENIVSEGSSTTSSNPLLEDTSSTSFKTRTERTARGKRQEQTGRGGQINLESLAGTRDFPPEEYIYQEYLFEKFREASRSFTFQAYDCPILEPADLYKRKAGEEITQQMYNFIEKSGLEVTLRPEMTPSLARMIMKLGKTLLMPVRWYSIPQCWRYETTTRGRKREHYQWNADIWGVNEVSAEAELIALLVTFFESVGLSSKEIGIKVSSRKVLQTVLKKLGIPDNRFAEVCVLVDKLDKLEEKDVIAEMAKKEIPEDVSKQVIQAMKVKSIAELKDQIGDDPALVELESFFSLIEGYGISDWVIFDASIVRGLAYYTGIVFEGFSRDTELQRAVCGGGRYDRICEIYGAKQNIPACGFGFGDCVIMEILQEKKLLPNLTHSVDDLIIPFSEEYRPQANLVASILRRSGRKVDIYLKSTKKIKQCFSYADRVGAWRAVFIAPEEWNNGGVNIKYLRKEGKQYFVKKEELATFTAPEDAREE